MRTPGSTGTAAPAQSRRTVTRFVIREVMGVLILGVILFLSAGTVDWPMAWALLAITVAWIVATLLATVKKHPELLAERIGPRKGARSTDTAIMGMVGVLTIVRLVVAGLDVRKGWTQGMPLALQLVMLVIVLLGYAVVVWATASNPFFSQIVRIQKERGHYAVSKGPYRLVRHPAYVGSILQELATPIMLGSWWALIPGIISFLLFVIRTALEDRFLEAELDGYREYARKVRYRLLPGIW